MQSAVRADFMSVLAASANVGIGIKRMLVGCRSMSAFGAKLTAR